MEQNQTSQEQEMREIFASTLSAISSMRDKVITTVVAHSRQADEISKLREDFSNLQQRMNAVVDEAQRYRTDLHAVISERDKYKRDSEDNLALAQGYQKDLDDTKQRLSEAHSVSTRLGEDLAQEQRNHETTKANLERACQDRDRLVGDRDYYRERYYQSKGEAEKAEQALKEANDKLSRLQGVVRELFPDAPRQVMEEAKPVELPGQAPSFQEVPHGYSYPVEQPSPVEKVEPHPVQSAGEHGVNERIDGVSPKPDEESPKAEEDLPWWKKTSN